jgi:hypothetical protein
LARPGGNATGFFGLEPSLGGKWLELLKEIVPGLRRVAVIFSPETSTAGTSYLHSVETAAPLFSVEATGAPVHHAGDIELAISSLVREPGGGLSSTLPRKLQCSRCGDRRHCGAQGLRADQEQGRCDGADFGRRPADRRGRRRMRKK